MENLVSTNELQTQSPSYNPVRDSGLSEEYLESRFSRQAKQPQAIVYERTNDPALLHQYYRLREQMFIHVWGLKHFSGQKDIFDDNSEIIVARIGNHCIGGCRLTFSHPGSYTRLPMEKDDFILADQFPELSLLDGTYLEVSRLAILPEFQNGEVMLELTRAMFECAAEHKARYAFALAPVPLARSYRKTTTVFGGPVWRLRSDVAIPDREEYEGIKMMLSVLDLQPAQRQKAARPKMRVKDEALLLATT